MPLGKKEGISNKNSTGNIKDDDSLMKQTKNMANLVCCLLSVLICENCFDPDQSVNDYRIKVDFLTVDVNQKQIDRDTKTDLTVIDSINCSHPTVIKKCVDNWCVIPSGCFKMGSPEKEPCRYAPNEQEHFVTLTHGFQIMQSEVTQNEFKKHMGYNPSSNFSCGLNCPVEMISWHESSAFCNELSKLKGYAECYEDFGSKKICTKNTDCSNSYELCIKGICSRYRISNKYSGISKTIYECPGYRLPTDAEWEYAYRSGTNAAYYNGKNSQATCKTNDLNASLIGWYKANSNSLLHIVKQKNPNLWGIYDMPGNVWEWCNDWQDHGALKKDETNPLGPTSGTQKIIRGGSWGGNPEHLRAAYKASWKPIAQNSVSSFRCVKTL